MNTCLHLMAFLTVLSFSCTTRTGPPPFAFKENGQGVELLENGKSVYFYQRAPKSLTAGFISNNYLHPLYSLQGDTLTEEFPADHPHHRGIFWAWHQIYIDGEPVGDGWFMENIQQEVASIRTETPDSTAVLKAEVLWRSPLFEDSKPFVAETTTISVYPRQKDVRKIDFTIALKALVPGVEIGGSDDKKGYGGFSARLKLPDDLTFTSTGGPVTPKTEQVAAGPWMDFSASFGETGETSGVAILCHPETPNYPAPWILRAKSSMQNIVFPGRERVPLPAGKPVVLHYRLLIHNGGPSHININTMQSVYKKMNLNK